MNKKVKKLITYIANASQQESVLLYSEPNWYVFSVPLLDEICTIFGVPKEDVSAEVGAISDIKEATKT